MLVSIMWLALLGAALTWELYCSLGDQRWISITKVAVVIGRTRLGQLLLVAVWGFVGWHLFARYTLPR